jgi:octaprenyl-diphosphate synthase
MNTGKASISGDEIRAPVRRELELVERELARVFSPDITLVSAIGRHLSSVRGKRARPTLVLLCSKLGEPDIASAVKVAAAVELIHTATLLHDDSIDRSHLRRGLPTINRLWSDQVSVIMGDHLFCSAFRLLHDVGLFEIASVFSRGSDRLTLGEMFQMDLRGQMDVSEESYTEMIKLKTGALFAASCEAGSLAGGLPAGQMERLSAYGEHIGIAFQMIDDVLDLVGDQEAMGKPTGNDLRDGRITLPLIIALKNAGRAEAGRMIDIISSKGADETDWEDVIDFVRVNGGIDYTRDRATDLAARARACVEGFDPSPARRSLILLTERLVSRHK